MNMKTKPYFSSGKNIVGSIGIRGAETFTLEGRPIRGALINPELIPFPLIHVGAEGKATKPLACTVDG
jgi:hypothetical protein